MFLILKPPGCGIWVRQLWETFIGSQCFTVTWRYSAIFLSSLSYARSLQLITTVPKQPSMAGNLEQGCDAEKWLCHLHPSQAGSSDALGSPPEPQRASSFSQQFLKGQSSHPWGFRRPRMTSLGFPFYCASGALV